MVWARGERRHAERTEGWGVDVGTRSGENLELLEGRACLTSPSSEPLCNAGRRPRSPHNACCRRCELFVVPIVNCVAAVWEERN
ncbi:hypothetical protein O3P69_000601 [Scylla paramamosain]|uniref:Uncharacterized protein n=1 Tax=Scylla paramamosain TaxID=85552 RepID=A0AAW0UQ79_SCYPA